MGFTDEPACAAPAQRWPRGTEGQRRSDLGNGYFLNPVLAGDHPDPSVLKDGDTYYKVSSSLFYYPGLVIWKSTDLVNWEPVGPALYEPVGSVFAPDLVKHNGRYYIYFPAANFEPAIMDPAAPKPEHPILTNMVIHADNIAGPWSAPVDMQIYGGIDPGHVVGEDGRRYLFLSGGRVMPIADDGLSSTGKAKPVYKGWPIPDDWVTEGTALESAKLLRHNGWYYMFSAQGGTAGPPTSHMVVVARSRSVHGPWENCPHNPLVRTRSAGEPWWSRGHATAVEGPAGDWWLVYHAYENGYRTLGRAMLLEPIEWTADGWPRALGGDLGQPLRKPRAGSSAASGIALSDPFSADHLGIAFAAFKPAGDYRQRMRYEGGSLLLEGEGGSATESSPLLLPVGDRAYEVTLELATQGESQGGILLFYNEQFFCGLATDGTRLRSYRQGAQQQYGVPKVAAGARMHFRLVNRDEVATFAYSSDGKAWTTFQSVEVSGYNHNIGGGFLSLRPGIFAAGTGAVEFRRLRYRGLA